MVFPVVKYGCESWTIKKAEHQRTDAFKLCCWTLENPLDCREIKPVNPKGNQPWIFIGRNADEAEALILRPPDANSWLIGKDPDAGEDWRQNKKGATADDTVIASPTQWTWIWTNSRRQWRSGKTDMLQFTGIVKSQTWLSDWKTTNQCIYSITVKTENIFHYIT